MGHGCLHWQIHYKEVATECVLPQIPVVIRLFFYTHTKNAASQCSSS